MNKLRNLTALVGAAALMALAVALVIEVTDPGFASSRDRNTTGQWRINVADRLDQLVDPSLAVWQTALIGVALACGALVLVAAEFTRPAKGTRTVHNVHSTSNGDTRISGQAAMRAARREAEAIDGVVDTDATITGKHLTLTVRVDDRSNLDHIETQARALLGHGFWINLGLADFAVNILVTHHPRPPRVR